MACKRLELLSGLVVAVLLIVGDSQLAARVARKRILRHHFFQVGYFLIAMTFPAFHQRQVIQRARIAGLSFSAVSKAGRASEYFSHSM